jgi:long-subunit acyl-CoA synthetase (AMP-forming)
MSRILDAIAETARARGSDIALSDARQTISYRALGPLVDATAATVASLCPGHGPVALCADNSVAWAVIDLAFGKLKRTLVPIPPFFMAAQREHVLKECGAACIISDEPGNGDGRFDIAGERLYVERLEGAMADLPPMTAKVTYTSGTTGKPKGVCLSQAGLEDVSLSLVEAIGAEYAGTHFAVLPLAVLLENVAGLYTTLLAGGRYHVLPQGSIGFGRSFVPDFAMLVSALAQSHATSIIVVPEILRGILRELAAQRISLPDMKLAAVGGARVSRALLDAAEAIGLPVFQGYGLSEAASVVTLNTPKSNRPGSVGKVLRHAPLTLAPDGEVVLQGPALLGYAGQARKPAPYATGDIGGRKSSVLITAFGRNVSPEWVESELLSQPQIGQAIVFGESNPALGALIVPSSMRITDAELVRAVESANASLPEYAHVKHWTKVFPFTPANQQLTANGRLRREIIHDAYADLMLRCLEQSGQHVTFFERLVAETEIERNYLMATPQIRDGLAGRISLSTYRQYLAEAYYHVRHTVPLLTRVRDLLPADKAWLRDASEEYIAEEWGHEEWILDDIRNAGGNAQAVREGQPRAATELMVAYAYDYVNRINPAGFFGMVFVLEGTSTQLATQGAEALMKSLRLPENCFRYLTSHGTLDISHMQFFQRLMNRIDDSRDQADIIHMAKRMFVLFSEVFRAIPHDPAVQNAA